MLCRFRSRDSRARVAGILLLQSALLAAPLGAPRAAAEVPAFARAPGWLEVRHPDWIIVTNTHTGVTEGVTRLLGRFSRMLGELHPGLRTRTTEPLLIYVFGDAGQIDAYLPGWSESTAACFLPTDMGHVLVMSARTEGQERSSVVLHEFVHHWLHANFPDPPAWLNEGLAQYYSTTRFHDTDAEFGAPDMQMFRLLARLLTGRIGRLDEAGRIDRVQSELMSFDLLLAMDPRARAYQLNNSMRLMFYAQSLAFTHVLLAPDRGHAADFERLLERLRSGMRPQVAFRLTFPESTWASLRAEVLDYIGNAMFERPRLVNLPPDPPEGEPEVRALAPAEALTRLGELLLQFSEDERQKAAEHFRLALELDATAARAQVGLGLAADLDGRPEAAEEHYRRALAMPSRDAWLPVVAARGTLGRARRVASADASEDSVRSLVHLAHERFRRGLAVAPHHPAALAGSVTTRLMLDLPVDSTEVLRLERAAAVAPSRADLRDAIAALRRARATTGGR